MRVDIYGGAGQMGIAIAYGMTKLGHKVTICDNDILEYNKLERVTDKLFSLGCEVNTQYIKHIPTDFNCDTDLVISALPYTLNIMLAELCISNGVKYCDLGGHVATSEFINKLAEEKQSPVFTDLGLAPGLVNVLAENLYQTCGFKPHTVDMLCGGIPKMCSSSNPLNYQVTWSVDGLINEYTDDCVVLQKGKITTVPALSSYNKAIVGGSEFECFATSGGMSHTAKTMQKRGVNNCAYRTLRWPGHAKIITPLIYARVDNNEILKLFKYYEEEINVDDIVLIDIIAYSYSQSYCRSYTIYRDSVFTAMQRATGFGLAAVADLFCTTRCSQYFSDTYDCVNFKSMMGNLNKLGLLISD